MTKPLTLILWVSLSNFLIFIPQKKKKKLKMQKLSRLGKKKQPKGCKRQLVTISVTAGEATTDTQRGRKGRPESTASKLHSMSTKIMTGLSHPRKRTGFCVISSVFKNRRRPNI